LVQNIRLLVPNIFFALLGAVTYKTVGDHSDRAAAALKEWGLGKGDAVALYMHYGTGPL
jgi:acyl-CoA synthetase (AMP-forming)/AMP-acid ligase II